MIYDFSVSYFFSAIGMPHIETVRVFNPHPENTLRMLSISGSTPHFHCSFFQDKVRVCIKRQKLTLKLNTIKFCVYFEIKTLL